MAFDFTVCQGFSKTKKATKPVLISHLQQWNNNLNHYFLTKIKALNFRFKKLKS